MATNETSYVTKTLFWKGTENFEYTTIFEKLITRCSTFFDIGANTGYYSLVAAKVNQSIAVHSFEPSFGPAHFLKKNIQINKFNSRIHFYSIALSNQTGSINFFEVISHTAKRQQYNLSGVGTTKKIFNTQESSTVVKVTADTLDNIVKQSNATAVDLIKIDTEGTENLILQGARETITQHKPIIICETLFNQIEAQLEEIMVSHGYHFFNHLNGKLYKKETIKREEDNGVRDCFFVHPSKFSLINDFVAHTRESLKNNENSH